MMVVASVFKSSFCLVPDLCIVETRAMTPMRLSDFSVDDLVCTGFQD